VREKGGKRKKREGEREREGESPITSKGKEREREREKVYAFRVPHFPLFRPFRGSPPLLDRRAARASDGG